MAPYFDGLARDSEHEVEVQVFEPCFSECVERTKDHVPCVNTPKPGEQRFIQRLNAHRDAIDAVIAQKCCFIEGYGCGIALDGPFEGGKEIEALHGSEDLFPLL